MPYQSVILRRSLTVFIAIPLSVIALIPYVFFYFAAGSVKSPLFKAIVVLPFLLVLIPHLLSRVFLSEKSLVEALLDYSIGNAGKKNISYVFYEVLLNNLLSIIFCAWVLSLLYLIAILFSILHIFFLISSIFLSSVLCLCFGIHFFGSRSLRDSLLKPTKSLSSFFFGFRSKFEEDTRDFDSLFLTVCFSFFSH
ncbi:hypothetical protein RCL1_007809 [Eukaryota sp. TZLM3-RCL]